MTYRRGGIVTKFAYLLHLVMTNYQINPVSGTIYDIPCGDTALFETTVSSAQPGDVILLAGGSCLYEMGSDYILTNYGSNFGDEDGIIIKGKGTQPEDTILHLYLENDFDVNVIFDTVTLKSNNYRDNGVLLEEDSDNMFLFHNCILQSGPNLGSGGNPDRYYEAVYAMSIYLTLIKCEIINGGENRNTNGVGFEDHLFMLDSAISGFGLGLQSSRSTISEDDVRIFNTDLSQNDIDCRKGNDEECSIGSFLPNTKKGKNKNIWRNMNKLQSCKPYHDCYYLPLRIFFPRVNKAGETFVYRLPSAYPEPKPAWSASTGTGRPQYFQFYSTALLRKKNTSQVKLRFEKAAIDANFADPSKIVVAYYNGKKWRHAFLPLRVILMDNGFTEYYEVKFPKKRRLIGMIAFFEEE